MSASNYSINDLERLTGIKAHTIRMWEKRYQVVKPMRTSGNIRYYSDTQLRRLLNISLLLRNGFKISKTARLSDEVLNEKVLSISFDASNSDSQIENLIIAMMELDEKKFEKTIANASISLGFENTILNIIYPFFDKVGVLWQVGNINPAQEHFISNLLRQKLIVAIDGQISPITAQSKRFLLFLPEGEWHELGLLFYAYIIRKNGHKLIYLGQSVPFNNLLEIGKVKPPDVLVTSLSAPKTEKEIAAYFQQLHDAFPKVPIFVSGLQMADYNLPLPENVSVMKTLQDFKFFLNQ
ncbi:MAG: MerR family transcriptional regulator [Lentimicrobiaceae bacterium]|jgi:DNA-binding transcriptional MerR regulator|nr:MerR family transcriptional regulator [Lentimicrobiaceae bacterium]